MPDVISGSVRRLKYKHVFLDLSVYINDNGRLQQLMLTGPLTKAEKVAFKLACSTVNSLLEQKIYSRQYIVSKLRSMRGVDLDVLGFVEKLILSSRLPLE